jgi:hypothetical protein
MNAILACIIRWVLVLAQRVEPLAGEGVVVRQHCLPPTLGGGRDYGSFDAMGMTV